MVSFNEALLACVFEIQDSSGQKLTGYRIFFFFLGGGGGNERDMGNIKLTPTYKNKRINNIRRKIGQ